MSSETSISEKKTKGFLVVSIIVMLSEIYVTILFDSSSGTFYVILLILADYGIVKQEKSGIPRWIMIAAAIVYFAYYYISLIFGKTYLLDFHHVIYAVYLILYSEYLTRYILKNEEKILLDMEVSDYLIFIPALVFIFGFLLFKLWVNYGKLSDEYNMSVPFQDYLLTPYILSIFISFGILWLYDINAIMRIMSRMKYIKPLS